MKKLYGVVTAMTTPFDDNNHVDVEALRQQTDFLISKGVNCLYPGGTTGEMHHLSTEERELVAETVVKQAAGRVNVFIQVGAMTLPDTVRLAQHAQRIGADGVGVVTPCFFRLSERAMIQYYVDVCGALPDDFPVYVYVIPQLAGNDITAETMEILCEKCPNIVGVKYSYPDMTRFLQYLRVRDGNFSVLFGSDHLFMSALAHGADGVVSGCSGPFPEAFVKVYELFQQGDLPAARKAQERANEIVTLMKAGSDMSLFKNVLTLRGVRGGHVRRPLLDLPAEEVAALPALIEPYLK